MPELRDILNSGEIDNASFQSTKSPVLVWRGDYNGDSSLKGDVKRDGQWLMIAVNDTDDRPAPQPIGGFEYLIDGETFATNSTVSEVEVSHEFEILESGWVQSISIYPTEVGTNIHQVLYAIDKTNPDDPKVVNIGIPPMTANQWNEIIVGAKILESGRKWELLYNFVNTSESTIIDGEWFKLERDNNNIPSQGQWLLDRARTRMRIHRLDTSANDRSSELLSSIPTSIWNFEQSDDILKSQQLTQTGFPTLIGDYIEFTVSETGQGVDGRVDDNTNSQLTALLPVAQATSYAVDPSFSTFPSYVTNFESSLKFNGVEQPSPSAVFGVSIKFQRAIVSPDWERISSID